MGRTRQAAALLTLPLLLPASAQSARAGAQPAPAAGRSEPTLPPRSDHYDRVLRAYRGQLDAAALAAVVAEDPGPALYLEGRGPREIARLFASLPDAAHTRLRREGYLKWAVSDLPAAQRNLLRDFVRQVEERGEGPFPLGDAGERRSSRRPERAPAANPVPGGGTRTGFVRVLTEMEFGGEDPAETAVVEVEQYSWWIAAPGARRPVWLTLVRAVGLLLREHSAAHLERLRELQTLPDSPPIPPAEWVRLRDLPRDPPVPTGQMDPQAFRNLVDALRGTLRGGPLSELTRADPLLAQRLRQPSPADRAVHRLLGRLSREQLALLREEGVVALRPETMTRPQLELARTIVAAFNEEAAAGGLGEPYTLIPYAGTRLGYALVPAGEEDVPATALCFWLKAPAAPQPVWITLAGATVARASGYARAVLERLREQ